MREDYDKEVREENKRLLEEKVLSSKQFIHSFIKISSLFNH
jgi:hypothetical protein